MTKSNRRYQDISYVLENESGADDQAEAGPKIDLTELGETGVIRSSRLRGKSDSRQKNENTKREKH